MRTPPRIVVLGGPVPEELRDALADNLELVATEELADATYAAILVHATPGALSGVRRFRESGGSVPIYGYTPVDPDIHDRLKWIREGADDLVTAESAATTLIRRMRGEATRTPTVEVPAGVRLDRYLLALDQYLAARRDLSRRLGDGGGPRFMECAVMRQHVVRALEGGATPAVAAERRGSIREALAWGVRLPEAADMPTELVNVSADGVCFTCEADPRLRGMIAMEIDGLTVSARLEIDLRWRRVAAPDRWEAGGWATRVTITRSA